MAANNIVTLPLTERLGVLFEHGQCFRQSTQSMSEKFDFWTSVPSSILQPKDGAQKHTEPFKGPASIRKNYQKIKIINIR